MTTAHLHQWACETRAEPNVKNDAPGTIVRYAESDWEVAHVKQFPHGPMIGIYDEPPGKHIDYLHPRSVTIPRGQNAKLSDLNE